MYFDLSADYLYDHDIDGGDTYWRFYPSLKQYFVSKNKFLNNFWTSVYYKHAFVSGGEWIDEHQQNYKGQGSAIGLTLGRKCYLNRGKSLFIDFGLGFGFEKLTFKEFHSERYEFDWIIDEYKLVAEKNNHEPLKGIRPRIVFQIGYNLKK